MKFELNDPRLTAYVLDELDAAERRAVEAALQTDPALLREVEDIRRATERLTTELKAEPCPELSPERWRVIETKLRQTKPVQETFSWRRFWLIAGLSSAAVIVLFSFSLPVLLPKASKSSLLARAAQFIRDPVNIWSDQATVGMPSGEDHLLDQPNLTLRDESTGAMSDATPTFGLDHQTEILGAFDTNSDLLALSPPGSPTPPSKIKITQPLPDLTAGTRFAPVVTTDTPGTHPATPSHKGVGGAVQFNVGSGQYLPGGMIVVTLELPKAMFVGTPKNVKTPNLEPPRAGPPPTSFFAPEGVTNIALKKPVTASDKEPIIGELAQVTDGDKEGKDGSYVEFGPGTQWVQIDLKQAYQIYAVVLWHYHSEARVYRDVIVQVANDADFITGVRTIFNNDHDNSSGLGLGKDYEWIETNSGKIIEVPGGVPARYVRLYSHGNTSTEMNDYTEVEVYGK